MSAPVAVVVGAGGRLGAAVAARLLADGLDVLGVGRHPDRIGAALADAGGRLRTVQGDITDDAVIDTIARETAGRVVRVAVNAARPVSTGALADVPAAALAAAVDLKAGGLLRLTRAVDPSLVAGARVVAIGGRLGTEPDPRMCAAGIANAAVANLVVQLAEVYRPRGVSAHVIAPGAVAGAVRLPAASPAAPQPDLPTPDDVAWAVAALLHPAAGYTSGTTIALAGGRPSRPAENP